MGNFVIAGDLRATESASRKKYPHRVLSEHGCRPDTEPGGELRPSKVASLIESPHPHLPSGLIYAADSLSDQGLHFDRNAFSLCLANELTVDFEYA